MKLTLANLLALPLLALPLLALSACDSGGGDEDTGSTSTNASMTMAMSEPTTSDSGGTTAGEESSGGGMMTETAGGLSFAVDVYEPIIGPICTCHKVGSGGLTIGMDAATAYAALVNMPSTGGGGLDYVEPGDAAMSYLYQKITGSQGMGSQMPLGGAPLSAADMATIEEWINTGAAP